MWGCKLWGYLLKEDIFTLSFASRDSHKSQIQFAVEGESQHLMLGTCRLPFLVHSFDFLSSCDSIYCLRWDIFYGSGLLLQPGGYFVVSSPPVQWPKQDKEWVDLQAPTRTLCYELIVIYGNTFIWKKPSNDS